MGRTLKASEYAEQCAVVQWWSIACKRYGVPEFSLFAVVNANALASKADNRFALFAKLKREGLRSGIPDLVLAVPRTIAPGLYIEMKVKGNTTSDSQDEVITYLRKVGYIVEVCYGATEAMEAIRRYLVLVPIVRAPDCPKCGFGLDTNG